MKKVLIPALLVVVSAAFCGALFWRSASLRETSVKRLVRYGLTLANTSADPLNEVAVYVFSPLPRTAHQKLLRLSSSLPYETLNDSAGNQTLSYKVSLPPYGTAVISVEAELELGETPPDPKADESIQRYLKGDDLDLDHPTLQTLAKELKTNSAPSTAAAIHKWVARNIRRESHSAISKGAVYALQNRKGDCTEFASLFTALARIVHLPARAIGGFVVKTDTVLHSAQYHNWAEFHAGGKWQLADPFSNVFEPSNPRHIAFRIAASEPGTPLKQFERFRSADKRLQVKMN